MAEPALRLDLGRRSYDDALAIQRRLVAARRAGVVPDTLIFVEHPPVVTLGSAGRTEHVLADPGELRRLGVEYREVDRGGDVTFHGPGQLVGYPIVDLREWRRDVHAYLRAIESLLIDALAEFGIAAGVESGLTGVWHPRGKIAAVGVRVARWVTSHGFALNVSTDLRFFRHIVPCGIVDRPVTSMEDVLDAPVALAPVQDAVARAFARTFSREMSRVSEADLEVVAD